MLPVCANNAAPAVTSAALVVTPAVIDQPVVLSFTFQLNTALALADTVTIALPRFYSGSPYLAPLYVSPSTQWTATWTDGLYFPDNPYASTSMTLTVAKPG